MAPTHINRIHNVHCCPLFCFLLLIYISPNAVYESSIYDWNNNNKRTCILCVLYLHIYMYTVNMKWKRDSAFKLDCHKFSVAYNTNILHVYALWEELARIKLNKKHRKKIRDADIIRYGPITQFFLVDQHNSQHCYGVRHSLAHNIHKNETCINIVYFVGFCCSLFRIFLHTKIWCFCIVIVMLSIHISSSCSYIYISPFLYTYYASTTSRRTDLIARLVLTHFQFFFFFCLTFYFTYSGGGGCIKMYVDDKNFWNNINISRR